MVRFSRILGLAPVLVAAGLVAMGCADDASTTSRQAAAPGPTTTTVAALDVVETGFLVTTTAPAISTAPSTTVAPPASSPCDVPPDPATVPARVMPLCDATAGWRISAWIGDSGDGIVYLEHHFDDAWNVVAWGPFCGGVAAITEADLLHLGVPADLAGDWGVALWQCAASR